MTHSTFNGLLELFCMATEQLFQWTARAVLWPYSGHASRLSRLQGRSQLVDLVVIEVAVPVDGRRALPVTEHLLKHIDVGGGSRHQRRVRMAQIVELGPTQAKRIESSFPPGITPPVVRIEPNTSTRPQHQRRIRVPVSLGTLSDSRSEERRVGKECRYGWGAGREKQKS